MSAGLLAGRIYHPNWDPLSKNVMLCGKEVLSSCLIYTNVGGKGYLYVTGIPLNWLSGWQDVFLPLVFFSMGLPSDLLPNIVSFCGWAGKTWSYVTSCVAPLPASKLVGGIGFFCLQLLQSEAS